MKPTMIAVSVCLLVSGCTAAPAATTTPPQPQATVTVTAAPSPTPARVCEYGLSNDASVALIISSWDLVKASRDASDHSRMLKSMTKMIKSAQSYESEGCIGSAELAVLASAVPLVQSYVNAMGSAEDQDYEMIMAAGNDWLDAIGNTTYRFSMKPDDFGEG